MDVAVVNLVNQKVKLPVEGFGFLVPTQQGVSALGCVFDSCSFPPDDDDLCILTVMLGGHLFEKQFGNPDTVSNDFLLVHAIGVYWAPNDKPNYVQSCQIHQIIRVR